MTVLNVTNVRNNNHRMFLINQLPLPIISEILKTFVECLSDFSNLKQHYHEKLIILTQKHHNRL